MIPIYAAFFSPSAWIPWSHALDSFHYSPGLMERTEAFLLFELMILFPTVFKPLAAGFTVLVFLTAAARTAEFCRQA